MQLNNVIQRLAFDFFTASNEAQMELIKRTFGDNLLSLGSWCRFSKADSKGEKVIFLPQAHAQRPDLWERIEEGRYPSVSVFFQGEPVFNIPSQHEIVALNQQAKPVTG